MQDNFFEIINGLLCVITNCFDLFARFGQRAQIKIPEGRASYADSEYEDKRE